MGDVGKRRPRRPPTEVVLMLAFGESGTAKESKKGSYDDDVEKCLIMTLPVSQD